MSRGDMAVFVQRPTSCAFIILSALLLIGVTWSNLRGRRKKIDDFTLKRQLDAPECAVLAVPGKARRRSGLLPTRRSNAAWRGQRGAIGCMAPLSQEVMVIEV